MYIISIYNFPQHLSFQRVQFKGIFHTLINFKTVFQLYGCPILAQLIQNSVNTNEMMKSKLCFLALSLIIPSIFAQPDSIEKSEFVNIRELQQAVYEKDTSAQVVILYEKGTVEFINASKIIFRYYARYKVIKTCTDCGVVTIPFSMGDGFIKEKIKDLRGTTYNLENGNIVETHLTTELIKEQRLENEQYQKKFQLPDVKPGSVFEYAYTKEIPFSIDHNPPVWCFQKNIPVEWSEFTITIPTFLTYINVNTGYLPYFIKHKEPASAKCVIGLDSKADNYTFVIKDAPAFTDLDFTTGDNDDISRTAFYLSAVSFPNKAVKTYSHNWKNIDDACLHEFENYRYDRKNFSAAAHQISVLKDSMKQVHAAFAYISKTFTWNEQLKECLPLMSFQQTLQAKRAGAPELNLMLVNLLKQLGFQAYPVIISTRGHGKISDSLPLFPLFNYTLAAVKLNGQDILMDATDPLTQPGLLPKRCLNGKGRLIKKENSYFISLDPKEKRADLELVDAQLDSKTGTIKGTAQLSFSGYSAYENRMLLKKQDEEGFIKQLKEQDASFDYSNFAFERKAETSEELKIYYDFKCKADKVSGALYFYPLLYGRLKSNPFKKAMRIYPLDLMIKTDHIFKTSVQIPKGYVITERPQSVSIELPENIGKFTYLVTVMDNTLHVSSRITMNESYIVPEKYWIVKNFYDIIVRKQAEKVVLQPE